ncbi:MAG TPA: pyridoxal-dependent decarboxylase, partial [Pantanalinema sp.]
MALPIGSFFLGPAGENADILESFMLEALRDHVFWRRNFHPEDAPSIRQSDRGTPAFDDSLVRLRQELYSLLSRLKQGAPLFSPRYLAHMTSDVTMASLVGYFAAMLYNPNNVSGEASPVTTQLELDVGHQLGHLVGYGPSTWGHLASGGSVANLEALWAVRALKYFPATAWLVANELELDAPAVLLASGQSAPLRELTPWQLMNVQTQSILDLRDALAASPETAALLETYSLGSQGFLQFHRHFETAYGAPLPVPVLMVPGTKHYSWVKTANLLGLGQGQLIELPLDVQYRIDPQGLKEVLDDLTRRQVPVLAMISVLGSTETGSVDALDQLLAVRTTAQSQGLHCYCHIDGAYGGYATAMFRSPQGEWVDQGNTPELFESFKALAETDSITIDPHKLGYIPYPAGAVVFRDERIREFLSVSAPYVFHDTPATSPTTIGKYILEGSKPGAAAAAVWLSHRVLPLDTSGYGVLIGKSVECARKLWAALDAFESRNGYRIVPLNEPDLNVVTFLAIPPVPFTGAELNRFNDTLYKRFAVNIDRRVFSYEFVLSKTDLGIASYRRGLEQRLGSDLVDALAPQGGVTVLRATIMNPFSAAAMADGTFLERFLTEFEGAMAEVWAS